MTTEDVYSQFKIDSLLRRRQIADLIFFYKSVNGHIESPEIREQFQIIHPRPGLRQHRLLDAIKTTKNYVFHGPRNRIANLVNEHCQDTNFFEDSMSAFITKIKRTILNN